MSSQIDPNVTGREFGPSPLVQTFGWMARSDSMDIINDPRFFGGSVLDRRIDAFVGLGVVSGLLVGTAMDQCFEMKKDMHIFARHDAMDYLQFTGFILMTLVLFFNLISTYVSVAQVYHTYRLLTGGPTGFESAKLYYLNPNIAFWRHVSIKALLNSLWIFLVSSGFRMWVKFSRDASGGPGWVTISPSEPDSTGAIVQPTLVDGLTLLGLVVCIVYIAMGLSVYYIHHKHVAVFRERYLKMAESQEPLMNTTMGLGAAPRGSPLDV